MSVIAIGRTCTLTHLLVKKKGIFKYIYKEVKIIKREREPECKRKSERQ